MAASTFQAGADVYYIESNVPKKGVIESVKTSITNSQKNEYQLKGSNALYQENQLFSSKANMITAFTNATNALP